MAKRVMYRPVSRGRAATANTEPSGGSKALRMIGSVLAPTTVLTGLLLFFGRQHANWLFTYFGVPPSTMGLTAQDYLVRSADGLFQPLAVVTAATLLLLWSYRWLHRRLSDRAWERMLRILSPVTLVAGLLGLGVACMAVFVPSAFAGSYSVPGSCLALGVLSLVCTSRLAASPIVRPLPDAVVVTEWSAAFVLVSVGLFWAVSDYSASVGVGRAMEIEATLESQPETILYSPKSLSLRATGVHETVCSTADAAYRYSYTGLKLILQSGGQYLFLPSQWNRADGVALLVPRTDSLRLEFTRTADPDTSC